MPQRHVLLSSMKNEGPFVLEFVAHHRVLGFDEIHIATNDCTDGTDLLLDVLAENRVVTHTRNEVLPGEIPQRKAYQRIREAHDLSAADWLMVLDVDEFLMVNRGNRRVGDLTELAPPEVDLITLSALNFGTSNSPSWKPGRVTRQFSKRLWGKNLNNSPVKSLSRGHGVWGTVYNHHPRNFMGGRPEICYMRGNGEISLAPNDGSPSSHFRHFKLEQITQDLAWYNHYPIKSMESYMVRRARGRGAIRQGGPSGPRHTEDYWGRFAGAKVEDKRIDKFYGREVAAEMARILALPGVAKAQAEVERLYGELIAAVLEADETPIDEGLVAQLELAELDAEEHWDDEDQDEAPHPPSECSDPQPG